jgi:23S rRNA pseudouridine1911/1915/1917 synthase
LPGFRFRVPDDLAGERLDRIVALRVEGLSRSAARRLIDAGRVRVDGRAMEADDRPTAGAQVEGELAAPPPSALIPEPFRVPVLYEDEHLLVLDKPAGLTVHPGAGRRIGTLVHQLLSSGRSLSAVGAPDRPGIVHRLDRETSGCLVVARSDAAHHALAARFRGREVVKEYRALVCGVPRRPRGRIETPVGRHPQRRILMSTRSRAGRPALTEYRVLGSSQGLAWLSLEIKTGRTHQIRVHLSSIGHPVVGDRLYGGRPPAVPAQARAALGQHPRLMLHALRLEFEHPLRRGRVEVEAPLPPEITAALDALGILHSPAN